MTQTSTFRIATALAELYAQLPAFPAEPGVCPVTGYGFEPSRPKDRRLVSRLRAAWSDAEVHFGLPLLSPRRRDVATSWATEAMRRCTRIEDRADCAEVLVVAGYFSRSLICALDRSVLGKMCADWRRHAHLATYIPHLLAANRHNPQFVDRFGGMAVLATLVGRYGEESHSCIETGETFWPME